MILLTKFSISTVYLGDGFVVTKMNLRINSIKNGRNLSSDISTFTIAQHNIQFFIIFPADSHLPTKSRDCGINLVEKSRKLTTNVSHVGKYQTTWCPNFQSPIQGRRL